MKQKTRKSVAKKVKITGRKKVLRRSSGQNHYNTRDTGSQVRAKRRNHRIAITKDERSIKKALPYA